MKFSAQAPRLQQIFVQSKEPCANAMTYDRKCVVNDMVLSIRKHGRPLRLVINDVKQNSRDTLSHSI